MKMSKHAIVRQQQRAIPPIVVDLLLNWGCAEHARGEDCIRYFFDKNARRGIKAHYGQMASQMSRYLDCYAIVSGEGMVITVAHQIKKISH
ncbi:MAG: hypothetical protein ABI351_13135 [Herbaspirillum sp.]